SAARLGTSHRRLGAGRDLGPGGGGCESAPGGRRHAPRGVAARPVDAGGPSPRGRRGVLANPVRRPGHRVAAAERGAAGRTPAGTDIVPALVAGTGRWAIAGAGRSPAGAAA